MLSGTVGWVVAHGTVGFRSFVVRIRKVLFFFFPFSKFLSLVSLFRVGLSVRLSIRLWVRLRVRIVVRFRFYTVFTDRS